jgi:hypothetical protein
MPDSIGALTGGRHERRKVVFSRDPFEAACVIATVGEANGDDASGFRGIIAK